MPVMRIKHDTSYTLHRSYKRHCIREARSTMFSQIAYVNDNHTERVTLRSMLHFALFLFLVIKTKKTHQEMR